MEISLTNIFKRRFWSEWLSLRTGKPNTLSTQALPAFDADEVARKVLEDFIERENLASVFTPIASGRSSVDENAYKNNTVSEITPEFLLQSLKVIHYNAVHHADFSKAISNIVNLGNTAQTISFDAGVSDRQARRMRAHLAEAEKGWYQNQTPTTFVNTLLYQAGVFGCISSEAYPKPEALQRIKRGLSGEGFSNMQVVDVNPENVRYFMENLQYVPVQILTSVPNTRSWNGTPYIRLNPAQYKYTPILKSVVSPYGIPPFLSALFASDIQTDMMLNFKNIVKRIGAFGLLQVLLEKPQPKTRINDEGQAVADETPQQYEARLIDYLNRNRQKAIDGFNSGVVLGFKDAQEFKVDGTTNASNASQMFAMIDTILGAGLGQDSALLGRNRTETETFGRVILQVLISQIQTIQQCVAEFLDFVRLEELRLAGFRVGKVTTTFAPSTVGDTLKDEQAKQLRIANVVQKRNEGFISQTQGAQELGYDAPFQDAPTASNSQATPTAPIAGDNRTNPSATGANQLASETQARFDYSLPNACLSYEGERTDWGNATMQKFADSYISATEALYSKASKQASKQVGQALEALPNDATLQEWQDTTIEVLNKVMAKEFAGKVGKISKPTVNEMYRYYRKDKTIFPQKTESANSFAVFPPTAKLDANDLRAIDWLQKHDITFLSKFITDADTVARVLEFINEFYLEQGEAIGDNTRVLAEFINRFGDLLDGEIWKIRRVLDTSVNKIRSYAQVAYMSQAQVASFKVVEVMDRITCAHCQTMNGREFSVSTEKSKIETVTSSGLDVMATLSPFATSIPVDELRGLTNAEIQAKGIGTTPFHPSCRGTLVAVL